MVGDASEYAKLVAMVKKKVGPLSMKSPWLGVTFSGVAYRKHSMCLPRNSLSARAQVMMTRVPTSTTMRRSAAVMCVVLFRQWNALHRDSCKLTGETT